MNRKCTFFRAFAVLLCVITLVCAAGLSVSADAEPVDVIHGRDVVLTFDYPDRTTSNKSVYMGYDGTVGVMSIWMRSDYTVTDADATTFDVHLGHNKALDGAKYIALGLSYSAGKTVSASVLTEDTALTAETITLTDEITNIVFDASAAADGSVYDRISINSGYAAGEVITTDTALAVKYIAFFDTKDAAEAYVYTKPADKTYNYVWDNHIKSVSFNVRTAGHAIDSTVRSYYIAPVILGYDPDIIGLQEANSNWYAYLKEHFGDEYDSIVKWRTTDDSESTPIFWKKDKFELLDSGYFWLSETPNEQSLGWGATYYRICCYVKLKVRATGYEFYYFNTHWDFYEAAQIGSAKLFLNKIENECEGLPVILSADFNMCWNSEGYAMLDSYLTDANRDRDLQITYTAESNDTNRGSLIDFIFYTGDSITSDNYTVIKDKFIHEGTTYFLSDHYGVYNDIYLLGGLTEHTITYTNDVAGAAVNSQTVIENVEFALPKGAPILGKRFLGWTSDGGKTVVSGSYTAYGDTHFTAVYEDTDSYTVTYMNGSDVYKSETVAAGTAYTLISDVTELIPEAGYYFVNWADSEGNTVESIDSVIEDLTFYAVLDEIVPLKDYYVMTPSDLTPAAGTGFTVAAVDGSDTDTPYFRYTIEADSTSVDNSRATVITTDSDFFPAQFSLHDYKFMKVGYRSNISTAASMGMNLWSVGKRIYGPVVSTDYDGNWQTKVYNLSTIFGGEGGATFENSCDGPLNKMFLKPHGSNGKVMNAGEYFDIQYVAFFKTLAEADAYEYSYGLRYDLGGGTGGPASVTVFSDTEITIGNEVPTKEYSEFLGWSSDSDTTVDYLPGDTIMVTEDITLYAVWDVTHYVFDTADMTASAGSGFTSVETVPESEADTSYFRYKVEADATSSDGSRAWLTFDWENDFAAGFTLHDYKYMKIGYRTNISTASKMDMNIYSVHDRVYGPGMTYVSDGNWQTHVYDLSTITSGPSSDCSFENCCDGVLKKVFFKPHYPNGTDMLTGQYFDIQYVALFKTKEEADAFTYACTVTYDACGGTGAPASKLISAGDYVISDTVPTMENADFMGWSTVSGGNAVYAPGETVTVNTNLNLYAVWSVSHYVMDLDDYKSYTAAGGLIASAHAATGGDSSFVRFTVDGSQALSSDGTRGHIYFDLDKFASDFSLKDYPYMKVGYRALASDTTRKTTLGMNYVTNYGRLWGAGGDNFSLAHDGTWRTVVYTLSASGGGSDYGSYKHESGTYNFENCGDSPMNLLFFKPYRPDKTTTLVKGDYFDVQYIAFFKTEKAASAYEYPMPEFTLGDLDDSGKVEAVDGVMLSRYLAGWSGYSADDVNTAAADLNDDSKVEAVDGVILSRFLASWSGYLTLPYVG